MKTAEKQEVFIGIDWADQKHDFCLGTDDVNALEMGVVKHRPELLHAWLISTQTRFLGSRVVIGLEQSKGALAYQLMQYNFIEIYFVHPSTVAALRAAWRPSEAKDDPTDAELIMRTVRENRDRLRVWKPEDEDTRRLMLLSEHRRSAVDLRVKLTNMLRSSLKAYYPLACEVAGDKLNEKLALDFLTKWPTPEKLQRARETTVRSFYSRGNSRSGKAIEKRLEAISAARPITDDPVIIEAYSRQVLMLVQQLKDLRESIAGYDKELVRLYTQHDDAKIIASFPATGKVFGPRPIAALGTNRERFGSVQELLNFSGIAPVTERSGKALWVHRRWPWSGA